MDRLHLSFGLSFSDSLKDLFIVSQLNTNNRIQINSYLEKLSSSTESIDSLLVKSIVIKLDKILPAHIFELIGVLVQSQTTQPAGNVAQKLQICRILWGLGTATSTTR